MEATMEYTGKPLPGMKGFPGTAIDQGEVFSGAGPEPFTQGGAHHQAGTYTQTQASAVLGNGAKVLTESGFKALSKEEREEAKRIALEAGFSFEGYQVVRREFFSHRYDPTLTIKGNSITFNNACISRLEEVVYVQVLVNPLTETLVIRPCSEGARDAIRWCIAKNDKRKSRQITCGIFTAKLYELMGWEALYRYKLQGTQITHKGEQLFVFDLTSTETFLPATKDPENPDAKPKRRPPVYPANWRDSFGIPVAQHEASTKVSLEEGYSYADELPDKTGTYGSQEAEPVSEVI